MAPTIAGLLTGGVERLRVAGSETPRLDAEILLGYAIGIDRTAVLAHPEAPVGADAAATYEGALVRRAAGEPVAYIRGFKEFYGLAIAVDERVLIPRPETETLVELAEREIVRRVTAFGRPLGSPPIRVAEVGTGSGAVAVALAVRLRRRRMAGEVDVLAIDASPGALAVARENAVGHAVADSVRFAEADLLPEFGPPYHLVVANLPYIPTGVLPELPIAASFEPRQALDGGADGLVVIRRLLERLPDALARDGQALLEIGADQGPGVRAAIEALLPGWDGEIEPDLGGSPRVVRIRRPAVMPR